MAEYITVLPLTRDRFLHLYLALLNEGGHLEKTIQPNDTLGNKLKTINKELLEELRPTILRIFSQLSEEYLTGNSPLGHHERGHHSAGVRRGPLTDKDWRQS